MDEEDEKAEILSDLETIELMITNNLNVNNSGGSGRSTYSNCPVCKTSDESFRWFVGNAGKRTSGNRMKDPNADDDAIGLNEEMLCKSSVIFKTLFKAPPANIKL